jgi:hypothetical protein
MPESEADDFLEPLRSLADSPELASLRRHGIAIFVSENLVEPFRVDFAIEEQWTLGRVFRVRPLFPILERLESYCVLTLSEKRVALFVGDPGSLKELVVHGMPGSFADHQHALTAQAGTQIHSGGVRHSGKQGAVFHGQGGIADSEKADLENYLKQVDDSVESYLRQPPNTPLILAGVESLTSMYRQASHCDAILTDSLGGNVDHLSADELQQRVAGIVSQEQHRRRDQQALHIREQDVPTETNAELILVAASEGRIATLFINQDATLYGKFMADRRILKETSQPPTGDPAEGNHDLIELAAVQTLKTGGSVHAVTADEMPRPKKMVAALRF